MKKSIFKAIILLLTVIFTFSAFSACKNDNTSDDGDDAKTVTDVKTHKVEGTLHDVNVNYNEPVGTLSANGRTEYTVVSVSGYGVASKFVSKHLSAATGVNFPLEFAEECNLSAGKYIVFGLNELIKSTVTVPEAKILGDQGYYIKTVGDDVLVYCTSENGAQLAAIALLRALVGYDMMSVDCVIYEKSGDVLPAIEIAERPDYEFRINSNEMKGDAKYGMGFTQKSGMLQTETGNVHNLYDFFTQEDVKNHSKWFSEGAIVQRSAVGGGLERVRIGQPCFTAHGDKEEYEALLNHMSEKIIEILKNKPDVLNMRISQNDVLGENTTWKCNCAACNASCDYYGTLGGTMISFANDLAKKVNAYIDANEPGRIFNLVVLAYQEALQAPVQRKNGEYVLDEKGKGIPETRYDFDEQGNKTVVSDENGQPEKLVCGRGVAYEFAASKANWIHSFYETENREFASAIEAWAGLGSSNLYIWSYEISYYQYLYPYNNYHILLDNFKYFKEFGGNYIYPEGTWENMNNPGFAKLRDYINSKGMFDVNSDYNELVDKFFKYYFREAAPVMRKYFNEVQVNLTINENITGGRVHSYGLSDNRVWPEALVTGWLNSFDVAQNEILKYKDTDSELYEALSKHILIESLFPRYVLCTKYDKSFSASQIKEMRKSFLKDFEDLGNTTHQEHFVISVITSGWNLD